MKKEFDNLLTHYLQKIAREKTEVIGGNKVSKAEKLARIIFDAALGNLVNADGQVIQGKPDRVAYKMVFERLEGKPATTSSDSGKTKQTVADKVSDQAKEAIELAGGLQNVS